MIGIVILIFLSRWWALIFKEQNLFGGLKFRAALIYDKETKIYPALLPRCLTTVKIAKTAMKVQTILTKLDG